MHTFDRDIDSEEIAPHTRKLLVPSRWDVGNVPNGGYVIAAVARAIGAEARGLEPLTVTAHFLRPARHGAAELQIEAVKRGRRFSTFAARMSQAEGENLRVLATFVDRATLRGGPAHVTAGPPEMPEFDRDAPEPPWIPEVARRFDFAYDTTTIPFMRGEHGAPEIRAAIRFREERAPCAYALLLFADAFPPPALNVVSAAWLPTLEITIHVREVPAPGWIRARFTSRFVFGGLLETDGELWDERDRLVAQSRQLGVVPA